MRCIRCASWHIPVHPTFKDLLSGGDGVDGHDDFVNAIGEKDTAPRVFADHLFNTPPAILEVESASQRSSPHSEVRKSSTTIQSGISSVITRR